LLNACGWHLVAINSVTINNSVVDHYQLEWIVNNFKWVVIENYVSFVILVVKAPT